MLLVVTENIASPSRKKVLKLPKAAIYGCPEVGIAKVNCRT